MMSRRYLYLAVFTSGMTSLAVELSASRLLGNIYGTSNLVWANVIGLMLIYLTVGYFIGGRWADRSPQYTTFYKIMLWAAFLCGLIPLIARPILTAVASAVNDLDNLSGMEAGLALGSFGSILILFSVPVTLLGCVSPFAIRLAIKDADDAGTVSGNIYAISTLGSIVGTFTPVLFAIPALGTTRTFLLYAGLLFGVALGGYLLTTRRLDARLLLMPLSIGLLSAIILNGPMRPAPDHMRLLYEKDSAYNLIQIVEDERDGMRYLLLNEGQGYHSQWHPEQVYFQRTWGYFLIGPYFNASPYTPDDVQNIAIIGLAGGTIARQYTAVYGDIPIDGIEIDGEIIEASRKYLGMTMPNLNVIIQDGRYAFNQLDKRYSVVGIDAYRVPYVPWHLTTVEFFEEIRDKLTDNGVVVINVGRTPSDRRLVDAMANTMLHVFPTVHAMDVPNSLNTILVATRQPTVETNLADNFALLDRVTYPILGDALETATQTLVPVTPSKTLFTDDHAPVEQIIDSMVIDYLLNRNTP
ncbi:MAG: fused MFS/spermidine synthase [Anaerolineales bacterium]|nr:fused MFS/spermidine synthase [Anaerolineales bacterium]